MKPLQLTVSVLLALCAGTAGAQLYKSVGPDGKITYSDTPPPAATRIETRPLSNTPQSNGTLPYELAQASRNHPVVLYTTINCLPCDDGRKLLIQRGIPFQEKTVSTNDDLIHLRQAGGDGNLPFLSVGHVREPGFQANAWNSALTAAGYPTTSRLPQNYRRPPAEAAAPRPVAAQAKAEAVAPAPQANNPAPVASELPPAIGNAPPGFRF